MAEKSAQRSTGYAGMLPSGNSIFLRAEFEAAAPMREAMRIKRERLQAKREAKQR